MRRYTNVRSASLELSFVGKAGLALIALAAVLGVVYLLQPSPPPAATEAEARAKLQEVLDHWVARTPPKDPRVALKDKLAFRVRLLRYEVGPQKREERGVRAFPVTLTVLQAESPPRTVVRVVGLTAWPLGPGSLLAASAVIAGRTETAGRALRVARDYLILRGRANGGGERWEIVGRKP